MRDFEHAVFDYVPYPIGIATSVFSETEHGRLTDQFPPLELFKDVDNYGNKSARLRLGDHVHIGRFATLDTGKGGRISVGANSSINDFCIAYGHGGLEIGDGVRIAAQSVLVPFNHRYDDTSRPIHEQG